MVTVRLVLVVCARVCFLVGAIGVPSRVNLLGLRLFFWLLAYVVAARG